MLKFLLIGLTTWLASVGTATQPLDPCPTLLLIEDDQLLRELAKNILDGEGYTLHFAERPSEAVQIFEANAGNFSMIISDVDLKADKNGYELAKEFLEKHPDLPILFMSARSDMDEMERFLGKRPTLFFLQKPYNANVLRTLIRSIVKERGTPKP